MAFDVTAAEAAQILGISQQRVYQLIKNGSLSAERVGGIWLVNSESVQNRAEKPVESGRPSLASSQSVDAKRYVLMNGNHEIVEFAYELGADEFFDIGKVLDRSRAPLGLIGLRSGCISASALSFWWRHRSIPGTRAGLNAKLQELGIANPDQIPFRSLGLSLSDQYWIRPLDSRVKHEDLSFFLNDFVDMEEESSWLAAVGLDSPDNTSDGELSKKWICRKDKRVLLKGASFLGQEPFNEVVATKLYNRVLEHGDFVSYRLEEIPLGTVSSCANFLAPDEEYIPAYYVNRIMRQANHHNDYRHYLECCAQLGVLGVEESLSKMIVCDDILANHDRHWRNFGLIRNIETLECRPAPIFDSGSSLWCNVPDHQLRITGHSFSTKPFYEDANRQLRLVNDYSWLDLSALDGFAEEAMEILEGDELIANRLDFIREGIQSRIDRLKLIA